MAFAPDGLTSVGGYPGDDEKGGAALPEGGQAEDDRGFHRGGALAESAAGLHRQDRRGGLLLWRRHRQHAGGAHGLGSVRGRAVLWRTAPGGGRAEDQGAVLLHYASLDTRITGGWPAYEEALKANHVTYEGYVYEGANHGFHNDTTPRYDEAAAKLAWQRTLDFQQVPAKLKNGTRQPFSKARSYNLMNWTRRNFLKTALAPCPRVRGWRTTAPRQRLCEDGQDHGHQDAATGQCRRRLPHPHRNGFGIGRLWRIRNQLQAGARPH